MSLDKQEEILTGADSEFLCGADVCYHQVSEEVQEAGELDMMDNGGINSSSEETKTCQFGYDHFIYAPAWSIIYLFVLVALVTTTVIGNLLIIVAVLRERRLHSTQYLFYVNLAVADFFIGLAVMPPTIFVAIHECWIFGGALYRVWIVVHSTCFTASYLSMCAVALERFLVVKYPFLSRKCETRAYKITFMVTSWLLSAFTWIPTMILCEVDTTENAIIMKVPLAFAYTKVAIVQYIPLVAMVTLYTALILKIKRGFQLESRELRLKPVTEQVTVQEPSPKVRNERTKLHRTYQNGRLVVLRRHYRAARMLGALILAFVTCWLPWMIVWPIYTTQQAPVPDMALKIPLNLAFLNSALNPFLYAYMSKEFQCAVMKLVCPKKARAVHLSSSRSLIQNRDNRQ